MYWIVSATQYQLKKKGVSHTRQETLWIGNTQSVVTTMAKWVDNQLVEIRQCTEPEQELAGIYEKLNMDSLPLKRRRKIWVIHFNKAKKQISLEMRQIDDTTLKVGLKLYYCFFV